MFSKYFGYKKYTGVGQYMAFMEIDLHLVGLWQKSSISIISCFGPAKVLFTPTPNAAL